MTKEEKLVEFIKRTSDDPCPICRFADDMRQCEDDFPPGQCEDCQRECHCKDCWGGSGFELDEKKLDEWAKKQK